MVWALIKRKVWLGRRIAQKLTRSDALRKLYHHINTACPKTHCDLIFVTKNGWINGLVTFSLSILLIE